MEEEGELPHGLDIVFVHSRNECEPATPRQVVIPLTTLFPSVDAYTSEWMIQVRVGFTFLSFTAFV